MVRSVTVLGGYGTFGGRIAAALATHPDTVVRVVGRDPSAGTRVARTIGGEFRACDLAEAASLRRAIEGAQIVIHAAGPFQGNDYRVAELCLEAGTHYLDIADARAFVTGIAALDEAARQRGLFVSSGVSSVPAVTHALICELRPEFRSIDEIQIALSAGNQNPRGASTIGAILSYLGRPIRVRQDGRWVDRPGWGDARRLQFPPPVGGRRVHRCDVPDLELFPDLFGAPTVRFHAGVELDLFNYALSALGRLRRLGALKRLPRHARLFLRLSLLLDRFGTKNGSLAVWLRGTGRDGKPLGRQIAIVTDADGPATPCSPAIVLARKILDGGPPRLGAFPCTGFVALDELMGHLRPLGIWCVRGGPEGWAPRS